MSSFGKGMVTGSASLELEHRCALFAKVPAHVWSSGKYLSVVGGID